MRKILVLVVLFVSYLGTHYASAEVSGCKVTIDLGYKPNLDKRKLYSIELNRESFSLRPKEYWINPTGVEKLFISIDPGKRTVANGSGGGPSILAPGERRDFTISINNTSGALLLERIQPNDQTEPSYKLHAWIYTGVSSGRLAESERPADNQLMSCTLSENLRNR